MLRKILISIFVMGSLGCSAETEFPNFALGYGSTQYKSPVLYGRKDYFRMTETLQRDQLSFNSLDKCINRISTPNQDEFIKQLLSENKYLKLQNEKLLNEILYNKNQK